MSDRTDSGNAEDANKLKKGAAWEAKVMAVVLGELRTTDARKNLKKECGEVPDEVIEQAMLTLASQERMQTAVRAFLMEHTPRILLRLIDAKMGEKEKLAAAKQFLELAGVREAVREVLPEPSDDKGDAGLSAAERMVVERMREVQAQRLRGSGNGDVVAQPKT